MQDELFMKLRF